MLIAKITFKGDCWQKNDKIAGQPSKMKYDEVSGLGVKLSAAGFSKQSFVHTLIKAII